jgi:hypothetical protein
MQKNIFLTVEKSTGTGVRSKTQSGFIRKRIAVPVPDYTRLDPEPVCNAEKRYLTAENSSGTGKKPGSATGNDEKYFKKNNAVPTCLGYRRTRRSPSTKPSPPPSGREPERRRPLSSTPPWAAHRRRRGRGLRGEQAQVQPGPSAPSAGTKFQAYK